MKTYRKVLWGVVLIGFAFSYYVTHYVQAIKIADTGTITDSGEAEIGGDFTLTDQNGKQVSNKDFSGKYMLVFFGFTNCPMICPTELLTMTEGLKLLGQDAKKMAPIFITVDPERDTPERMKEYLKNYHPAIVGLSGKKEDIEKVEKAYKVFASKVPNKEDKQNYNVDHSAYTYLMGPDGKFITHFNSNGAADKLAEGIKKHLK